MSGPTITLEVIRYRPGQDLRPTFQDYEIPYREDWVVLDALNYIKDYVDGMLSFRWSCRMGVCGSCGMMVNRSGRLTCAAFLRDYYPNRIRIEPMDHFPIIRDLIVDMTDFLDKTEKHQTLDRPGARKATARNKHPINIDQISHPVGDDKSHTVRLHGISRPRDIV